MGKQMVIFADEVDLYELLVFAERRGFVALPDLVETDEEPDGVLPTEIAFPDEKGSTCFHLLPAGITAAEVFYREIGDEPALSRVMKNVSPVTEIRPSQRDGERLSDGRLHFNMEDHVSYFDQGLKGYEQLAHFVRKWQKTKQYRFYVGPHASKEVAHGRLRLVHWNEELSLA